MSSHSLSLSFSILNGVHRVEMKMTKLQCVNGIREYIQANHFYVS